MAYDEARRLIASMEWADKPKKRGAVLEGLIGWTDDGWVVHIPTGRVINPPQRDDGSYREDLDDRAFVTHLLDADRAGWEKTRKMTFGSKLSVATFARLKASIDSFPMMR